MKSVHADASTVNDGGAAASPEVTSIPDEGERTQVFINRIHELSDFYHLPLISRGAFHASRGRERERERDSQVF